jgi:hypothetical protein
MDHVRQSEADVEQALVVMFSADAADERHYAAVASPR